MPSRALSRRRRLRAIADVAARIERGDLSARLNAPGDDDVAFVAATVDGLAGRLEALERARGRYVSQVSHDLRSPLCVIRASAWALRRAGAEEQRLACLDTIEQEVDRVATLVDDLLALGRLRASVLLVEPGPVDLAGLVDGVVRRRLALAQDADVTLVAELPSRPVPRTLDPTRIEQVVANLVENAIQHAGPGGQVRVRLAIGTVDRLVVEDDGAGIEEADLPLVFAAFFRGSGRSDGTGLGLAIAHELVVAHGGRIRAENRAAGGARFTVELPAGASEVVA